MSIIIMIENKKQKKLLLSISESEFIDRMIFTDDCEKNLKNCKVYLRLKGVAYHTTLANFIGLNSEGKIE